MFLNATRPDQRRHYRLELECYKGGDLEVQAVNYRYENGFAMLNPATSETLTFTLMELQPDDLSNLITGPFYHLTREQKQKTVKANQSFS